MFVGLANPSQETMNHTDSVLSDVDLNFNSHRFFWVMIQAQQQIRAQLRSEPKTSKIHRVWC